MQDRTEETTQLNMPIIVSEDDDEDELPSETKDYQLKSWMTNTFGDKVKLDSDELDISISEYTRQALRVYMGTRHTIPEPYFKGILSLLSNYDSRIKVYESE